MKLYYRISDKSYEKQKLIGATKEVCLKNFCDVFHDHLDSLTVIADNCDDTTVKMLKSNCCCVIETNDGNAGSFRTALNLSLKNDEDELIYMVEDDYLHRAESVSLLQEGIKRADYVTLYDHPDKYTRHYDGGEFSKVIKTASSHWRYTTSTCMTFASKVKTLKQDMDVWKEFTSGDHPYDHFVFKKLTDERKRRLSVCIPGAACHTDLTFSASVNQILIDPWAIEMMIQQREKDLENSSSDFKEMKNSFLKQKTGWEKLVALDALFKSSIDNKK